MPTPPLFVEIVPFPASFISLVGPTGTPVEVVQKINREMQIILNDASIVKRLREIGFYTDGAGTPETTGQFIRSQYEAWGKVIREIGLKPE